MYKLVNDKETNQLASITKNDGSGLILSIPVNPENSDYIAYLKWLEEGNVALPTDE
jgi:Tfp pilus assembly protein PilZ